MQTRKNLSFGFVLMLDFMLLLTCSINAMNELSFDTPEIQDLVQIIKKEIIDEADETVFEDNFSCVEALEQMVQTECRSDAFIKRLYEKIMDNSDSFIEQQDDRIFRVVKEEEMKYLYASGLIDLFIGLCRENSFKNLATVFTKVKRKHDSSSTDLQMKLGRNPQARNSILNY